MPVSFFRGIIQSFQEPNVANGTEHAVWSAIC
jgi:hypothetical protein